MQLKYLIHRILKRRKFQPGDFKASDLLYRGFRKSDVSPETGFIETNSIRFPDLSCNWASLASADSVKKRQGAKSTDGCFGFSVSVSRYEGMATPCHDPLHGNYAHTEVRQIRKGEDILTEPPKERSLTGKDGWSKSEKLAYRTNMVNNLEIYISPQ